MKKTFLVPEYFLNFKCIGSDCEDTCCNGWGIHIDKNTYKKYNAMKSRNSDFSNKLKTSIKRFPNGLSDFNKYGQFILNQSGDCPFLSDVKQCEIQFKFGYELLCDTCKYYPRLYSTINEYAEAYLTLSCPEAARLALLNRDGISFLNTDISLFEKLPKSVYTVDFNNSLLEEYFYDIRIFTIRLLQNRNYSIEERLGILGIVFEFLESNKDIKFDLPSVLNSYQNNIDNNLYKNLYESLDFENIKSTQLRYLLIAQNLISKKVKKSDKPYYKEFENFLLGSKFAPPNKYNLDDIFKAYQHNIEEYYIDFMKNHSYIIENYLVDLVFKSRFPLNDSTSPFNSYLNLVSQYSVLRTELIGLLGYYKEDLDINSVVYLIQGLTTIIGHNYEFRDKLIESFYSNDINSVPALMLLFCH